MPTPILLPGCVPLSLDQQIVGVDNDSMPGYVIGKMLLKVFIGAPVVHDYLTPRKETLLENR